MLSLEGKKALIAGIANDQSIAWGVAKALKEHGADLAITYLNEKAEAYVRPLAESLDASIIAPLDVTQDGQVTALFDLIEKEWGELDTLVHSLAFCPKDDLHGRVVDCSRDGLKTAMDISVHSFIRMVNHAAPLMKNGGSCMTMSFYGSEIAVPNYNIMGPVKAALESVTRYLAMELGKQNITVNAISPGPLQTRAASGIGEFNALLNDAIEKSPSHHLVTIDDVGACAAFLASDGAVRITGGVHYVDAGYNIVK